MTKKFLLLIPLIVFLAGCGERNVADVNEGPFRLLGQLQTRGWAEDVAIDDTIAVVADGQAGTTIVTISDVAAPETLATYAADGHTERVTHCVLSLENGVFTPYLPSMQGLFLYNITTGEYDYGGFNISSNIYKMELVSKLDTLQLFASDGNIDDGFYGATIAKSGGTWDFIDNLPDYTAGGNKIYGFALNGDNAVLCIDQLGIVLRNWVISEDIVWVDTPGGARDAVWVGDYIYVADYGNGLQVIDASTPPSASIVASVMPVGSSRLERIAADGDYLFVLDANDGIYVIDISNPLAPAEVQLFELPEPSSVVARDGKVFVTDNYSGLLIYGM